MYLYVIFINLFKVSLGPYAYAYIYARSTHRSDSLHLLHFACQSGPSRGWSVRRILLPFVSWQDCNGHLMPIIIFVLQGVNQRLGYFLALSSPPCLIWKIAWGVRSVIDGPFNFSVQHFMVEASEFSATSSDFASNALWTGAPEMSVTLLAISAQAVFNCPFWSLWGVSALVAG